MLNETIATGLNNPECAFFIGQMFGASMTFKIIIAIVIIGFLAKAIDRLAWNPLIKWIKDKIYKSKK